jgi:predicted CxxxxCH...CXXCH cytochrome family protein
VGTVDGYSRHPVSSFTSITKALISVASASATSCHSLGEPNAQAFTYKPLIERLEGSSTDSCCT